MLLTLCGKMLKLSCVICAVHSYGLVVPIVVSWWCLLDMAFVQSVVILIKAVSIKLKLRWKQSFIPLFPDCKLN
jgi:hypothetical protein